LVVELSGAYGTIQVQEVGTVGNTAVACPVGTLGLTLADATRMAAGLPRHLVQTRTAEHCRERGAVSIAMHTVR